MPRRLSERLTIRSVWVQWSGKSPEWRNWQTRYVQGVVRVPSSGFKSRLRQLACRGEAFANEFMLIGLLDMGEAHQM
jgi:hypothetical protein